MNTVELQTLIDKSLIELKSLLPDYELTGEPRFDYTNRNKNGRFSEWHFDFTKPPVACMIRFSRIHPIYGPCIGYCLENFDLFLDSSPILDRLIVSQIEKSYEFLLSNSSYHPVAIGER